MTPGQTGGSEYETRLQRAEALSSPHSGATEFLVFYRHVASFQKFLHANIAAANQFKPSGGLLTGLRGELDLTVLLPHFRGYLSVIEQRGPSALSESARQMAFLTSDAWIASLDAYWKHAGVYDQQIGAFAQFLARAFLEPYAEFRGQHTVRAPLVGTSRLCPVCASRPLLGVLRPEACDTCKFYLRTIDLTKNGNAVPRVDDLAAIPHSLWAHEQGYARVQPNLLGT